MYFPKERATRRRRPFCFVTFDSHQAAERAVAESNRVIEVLYLGVVEPHSSYEHSHHQTISTKCAVWVPDVRPLLRNRSLLHTALASWHGP